jgi:hypothetical protein
MFVPHPEFNDILVDTETHKNVTSRDLVNNYFYYNEGSWCVSSEVDTDNTPLTKEEYILYYCKNEDGKTIYKGLKINLV